MEKDLGAQALLQLRKGASSKAGPERIRLLETIQRTGSITAAAKAQGLSYKGAWDAVQALNNLFEQPLVAAQPGGRGGGEARVTPAGVAVLGAYQAVEGELTKLVERLEAAVGAGSPDLGVWSFGMRTSARNALRGVVEVVTQGAVNSEVMLKVSEHVSIVAVVTDDSVQALGLKPGREALALIKSSFIILATGHEALRTSARNCINGVVVRHERGAVNDEVVLEIDPGKTLVAIITSASAEALEIKPGAAVQALIKPSHIILAVD